MAKYEHWVNILNSQYEFNIEFATKIYTIDNGIDINPKDIGQLMICLNTWAELGEDMAFIGWKPMLRDLLLKLGLKVLTEQLDEVALALVAHREPKCLGEVYYNACNYISAVPGVDTVDNLERFANLMQLLRFTKRFTYEGSTVSAAERAALSKFREANKSCWSWQDARSKYPYQQDGWCTDDNGEYMRDEHGKLVPKYIHIPASESEGQDTRPGYTLILAVKRYLTDMLGEECWTDFEEILGGFSSGSAWDPILDRTIRKRADKIRALYMDQKEWMRMEVGNSSGYIITRILNGKVESDIRHSLILLRELRGSKMLAVPKNMTSRRLICPEPILRAWYAFRVRKLFEGQLSRNGYIKYLNWEDQGQNRYLALLGSVGCGWSTLDLSSASDYQSRDLTFMLLPEWSRSYVYNSISNFVRVGTDTIRVRCLSTSGNQLTWFLLGAVVWAIAEYGCSWYTDSEGNRLHASAYGDDLAVPDCAVETVVQLLTRFGFVVNNDKSYSGDSAFRESCGGDYYCGYDVTPKYWKRGIVDISNKTELIEFIVNLQHKLYRYPRTRTLLNTVARALDPLMTASPIGWECTDLWDGNVSVTDAENMQHRGSTAGYSGKHDDLLYDDTVQWHQYISFLYNGPRYASDEDRDWGISSSYLDRSLVSDATPQWGWLKSIYLNKR